MSAIGPASLLLAARVPNEEAIALSPTIGWLLLACAACVVAYFMAHGDKWRRWWLSSEDPRGIAMFRIVFGFFSRQIGALIQNSQESNFLT